MVSKAESEAVIIFLRGFTYKMAAKIN